MPSAKKNAITNNYIGKKNSNARKKFKIYRYKTTNMAGYCALFFIESS